MAFYRQLLVFTVPSVAVLFGIYWYRRRRGFGNTDPGGNIRNVKTLKQELEEVVEQAKVNQNHCSSPTKLIVKSAPIDIIPNGFNSQRSSPIHLTDKELDIEIDKVISQKTSEMEYTHKKNSKENTPPMAEKRPKSLPVETSSSIKEQHTKSKVSNSVRQEPVISCLTDQLLNSKLNDENKDAIINRVTNVVPSTKSSVSPVKEIIKEEVIVEKSLPQSLSIIPSKDILKEETEAISVPLIECTINEDTNMKCEQIINNSKPMIESKIINITKNDKISTKNKKSRRNINDKKSNTDKTNGSDKKINSSNENSPPKELEATQNKHNDLQSNLGSRTEKELITETAEIDISQGRDSANHSPSDTMLASPSIGHFSDNHSEGSNDSGKGCSESPSPPPTSAGDVSQSSNYICHQFLISRSFTGFLIGLKHTFIQKLNSATGAKVFIRQHPESPKYNVCVIEGIQQDVDIVLDMIKQKLPEKKFRISFKDVSAELCKSDYSSLADSYNLNLVEGVNNDVIISCYVSPSQLFLQQPMHPTYPSLHLLHTLMGVCYQDPKVPKLPSEVKEGMICAAPTANNWYRTQVIMTNTENDTSLVKLVDFGGFMDISNTLLKQIRTDFMLLPFQATEIQLAHVAPVDGGEWSPDAVQVIAGLTSGQLLQAQVVGYNEDGLPQVYLYLTLGPQQVISLNRELVVRGLAEWCDQEV
ncbi:A-kinase anchor protein spoonbill [Arctopsyche grandis]|uniref:A-kinase anchor protein spoonbill n=1 Tax=Arctopsyche grandis TaxID=121162 RepID=UPI00406D89CA